MSKTLSAPPVFFLEIDELLDLFGFFLLILIGIELLETIKAYLQEEGDLKIPQLKRLIMALDDAVVMTPSLEEAAVMLEAELARKSVRRYRNAQTRPRPDMDNRSPAGDTPTPPAMVLIGAFTKSAQFPFHFWLPNALMTGVAGMIAIGPFLGQPRPTPKPPPRGTRRHVAGPGGHRYAGADLRHFPRLGRTLAGGAGRFCIPSDRGTGSVEVVGSGEEDRRTRYVHVMSLGDPDRFRQGIKDGEERRVLEVMR